MIGAGLGAAGGLAAGAVGTAGLMAGGALAGGAAGAVIGGEKLLFLLFVLYYSWHDSCQGS